MESFHNHPAVISAFNNIVDLLEQCLTDISDNQFVVGIFTGLAFMLIGFTLRPFGRIERETVGIAESIRVDLVDTRDRTCKRIVVRNCVL